MRFSHKDKKDGRVSRQSTYAFDFPGKLTEAPEGGGVFILLNDTSDVLYVGQAAAGGFVSALQALVGTVGATDAVAYRWFVTDGDAAAASLAAEWIDKYRPKNQA